MKKIRLALIGCGGRGVGLAKLYEKHKNIKLVAACDIYEHFAKDNFPDIKCYKDYEKMLKEVAVDAVLIAADPDIQVDIACYVMNMGIHVMTEVPAAYSIKQCWDLVHTVEKTGCKYQLAEQTRYWGFFKEWRKMAKNGDFGKILLLEGEYLHWEPNWDLFYDAETGKRYYEIYNIPKDRKLIRTWRNRSFEHPIYYLPHTLSPLLSVVEERVVKVSCLGTRSGSYTTIGLESRDLETALMYTEKGTLLRATAGFTSPHGFKNDTFAHWYQIKGTKASAETARSYLDTPKLWTPENGWKAMEWIDNDETTEEFVKKSGHGGIDGYPICYFADAILNDKTPPMDVYKAVETAAPAILAAESSEKGGILLEVPQFRKV